nr:conserved repeat domain [uncultured bacterium]
MSENTPFSDWRRSLLAAVGFAVLLVALFYLIGLRDVPAAQAQGSLRLAISKTLEGSNVVRVGQYLTFTIRITNTGTITVVELPLLDDYEASILHFENAVPPPSTTGPGSLTWTDLTTNTLFGPLAPGDSISVVTTFRAIAPKPATVNHAEIGAAVGSDGSTGGGGGGQAGGGSVGGQVIIQKQPVDPNPPQIGQPISFTIALRNDGAADIIRLPLQDVYSTTYLLFWKAIPPPSTVNTVTGELRWNDLLPSLGLTRLRPNETITVTTVYTALAAIDGAIVNRATANGAQDEFGNQLASPRQTEVPIRILPGLGPTATPRRSRPPEEQPTPTLEITTSGDLLTPTSELLMPTELAGVEGTATPVGPSGLPSTGGAEGAGGWLMLGLVLLLAGALALRRRGSTP